MAPTTVAPNTWAPDAVAASVVAAIDIDARIGEVYRINHGVTPRCQALESIREIPAADLWWLSPPCQPYTRRGSRRAEADPRSAALEHLIGLIQRNQPPLIGLENVPEFEGSTHHHRLTDILDRGGYSVRTDVCCPTQWGVPMRRRRFYLRGRRDGESIPPPAIELAPVSLPAVLSDSAWDDPSLRLSQSLRQQYRDAIDVVDAEQQPATVGCFTSAYGKSPVRSGSYLRRGEIVRRFSPDEIMRLMGFRDDFVWPRKLDTRVRYALIGNSLSVTVVRELLKTLL